MITTEYPWKVQLVFSHMLHRAYDYVGAAISTSKLLLQRRIRIQEIVPMSLRQLAHRVSMNLEQSKRLIHIDASRPSVVSALNPNIIFTLHRFV